MASSHAKVDIQPFFKKLFGELLHTKKCSTYYFLLSQIGQKPFYNHYLMPWQLLNRDDITVKVNTTEFEK